VWWGWEKMNGRVFFLLLLNFRFLFNFPMNLEIFFLVVVVARNVCVMFSLRFCVWIWQFMWMWRSTKFLLSESSLRHRWKSICLIEWHQSLNCWESSTSCVITTYLLSLCSSAAFSVFVGLTSQNAHCMLILYCSGHPISLRVGLNACLFMQKNTMAVSSSHCNLFSALYGFAEHSLPFSKCLWSNWAVVQQDRVAVGGLQYL
jgi:hypothetical protein